MDEKDIPEFILKQAIRIKELEAEVKDLRNTGTGDYCDRCHKERMISLPSMNLKQCGCGYTKPWRLKKGQKSVLVKNLIGE